METSMQPIIIYLIVLASISAATFLAYYFPFFLKKIAQYQLQKYCSNHGILVLTYDDGPGSRLTGKLLKVLKDANVNATFFFLGIKAANHHEIIYKAMRAGHEIGCHGQEHINYWKVSPKKALGDIQKGYQSLSFAIKNGSIFRPPYGKLTLFAWLALKRHKRPIGWWTYVSGDTYIPMKPISDLLKNMEEKNGGVVLLHDFDRSSENYLISEKFVINSTKKLIELANKKQWKIMKLGEVMALPQEREHETKR